MRTPTPNPAQARQLAIGAVATLLLALSLWALSVGAREEASPQTAAELALGAAALGAMGLAGLLWGITRAQAAEVHSARARTLEAGLEHLVSASPAVLYAASSHPPHPIEFVSRNALSVFGYPPDLIADREWLDPSDLPRALDLPKSALEHGRAVAELRARAVDGTHRQVRDECRRVEHEGETLLVGCIVDVTEQRAAQEVLRRSLSETQEVISVAHRNDDYASATDIEALQETVSRLRALTTILNHSLNEAGQSVRDNLDDLNDTGAELESQLLTSLRRARSTTEHHATPHAELDRAADPTRSQSSGADDSKNPP